MDAVEQAIARVVAQRVGFDDIDLEPVRQAARDVSVRCAGMESATDRGARMIRHGEARPREALLADALPGRRAHLLPRAELIRQLTRAIDHLERNAGAWWADANRLALLRQCLSAEREAAANDAITAGDLARALKHGRAA